MLNGDIFASVSASQAPAVVAVGGGGQRPLESDDRAHDAVDDEDDETSQPLQPRGNYVIPIDETNPERTHRLTRAYVEEARLQRDLRAAGLL